MSTAPQRFTLIATLYVSQAIPLGFFIIAMPAILRSRGLSLENVGLLSALALPWLIKFAWAPLVDRFGSRRFGHYRSWILPLQTLSVLTVVGMSGIEIADGMLWLLIAGAFFMLCSATQDVATDGLAVRALDAEERGPANGIQVGGYYLGQILGGGLFLVVFHRLGWTLALLFIAFFLALPLWPAWRFREPPLPVQERRSRVDFGALKRFLQRPGAGIWVLILLLFRTGDAMALTMLNPMLVDLGISLEAIGLLLGLVGSAAALLGALLAGRLMVRADRKGALVLFGLFQTAAIVGYIVPALVDPGKALLFGVAGLAAFAGGMATTALYTNMMDRCDPQTAATDFTLQQSICAVGPMLGAGLSGFSAANLGYAGHFGLSAMVALAGVVVAVRWLAAGTAAPVAQPAKSF